MSYSIFDGDIADDDIARKQQDKINTPSTINKEMAQQAAAIANKYPTLPAGAVVGAARVNISPETFLQRTQDYNKLLYKIQFLKKKKDMVLLKLLVSLPKKKVKQV